MRRGLVVLTFVLGMIAIMMPLAAHHSFSSEFDVNKPTSMDGKVTSVVWTNPHVWVYMDVRDKAHGTVNWGMQLTTPKGLLDQGWKMDTLRAGADVCVEGFPAKNGEHVFGSSSFRIKAAGQVLQTQGREWKVPLYTGKTSCSNRETR